MNEIILAAVGAVVTLGGGAFAFLRWRDSLRYRALRDLMADHSARVAGLEAQLAESRADRDGLHSRVALLVAEAAECRRDRDTLREQIARMEGERRTLLAELAELRKLVYSRRGSNPLAQHPLEG